MAQRGDVLKLKTRLGFGAPRGNEPVIVVQSDGLNPTWPSLLVVPLVLPTATDLQDPTALLVARDEIGQAQDHVALTTQLRPVALDALEPGAIGRLKPATEARLDEILRLVLAV